MNNLYLGSIDLNKIKKEDIVSTDKNGNPFKNGAKYLNISVWVNDKEDQFGNHISIKCGKKEDSYYLGNAKKYEKNNQSITQEVKDDLPF